MGMIVAITGYGRKPIILSLPDDKQEAEAILEELRSLVNMEQLPAAEEIEYILTDNVITEEAFESIIENFAVPRQPTLAPENLLLDIVHRLPPERDWPKEKPWRPGRMSMPPAARKSRWNTAVGRHRIRGDGLSAA